MIKKLLTLLLSLWITMATIALGNVKVTEASGIVLGDQQTDEYLPRLTGKRVALFCNHTAQVGSKHLLDVLLAEGVQVTVLYRTSSHPRGAWPDFRRTDEYVHRGGMAEPAARA